MDEDNKGSWVPLVIIILIVIAVAVFFLMNKFQATSNIINVEQMIINKL
jgi:hypothetical protein